MCIKLFIICFCQFYQDNWGLGFSGYIMRGWEYYVIDGMDMVMGKLSFCFCFVEYNFNFGKFMLIS